MSDEGHSVVLGGYDVIILETDDPIVYHVLLMEGGNQVFEIDVPINLEGEDLLVEDIMNHAAQAAIDIYEAEKGALGEGAEIMEVEAKMKKRACLLISMNYEEWFKQLKGTPFEEQAAQLLEELIGLTTRSYERAEIDTLYVKKDEIEAELDRLNLERMKTCDDLGQTIIIQAIHRRISCIGLDWVEGFLNKFKGHRLEPQVIVGVKGLVEVQNDINVAEDKLREQYQRENDIRGQMDQLLIEKTRNDVEERAPEAGIDVAPNMITDIAELMDGVSFAEPLEPIVALNKDDEDGFDVEHEVEVIGEDRDFREPAEIPLEDRMPFGPGTPIKLTKDIEVPGWGTTLTVKKDTKGYVDSLYDGQGHKYYIRTEKGDLFCAERKDLAKA